MRFEAEIKDGKIRILNQTKYSSYLENLKDGRYFIDVKKKTFGRSNQQNRYYHGVIVKMISDETGYSSEEVHNLLLCNAFGFEEKKLGGMIIRTPLKRSSSLTTTEFEFLCRKSRELASIELSLYVPLPNEAEFEF